MDSTSLSLDDIIKKKKISGGAFRGKKNKVVGKKSNKNSRASTGGAVNKFNVVKKANAKPVLDARNKIIQKNRAKIHDARDKLVSIAKRSGDARLKLLKKNIPSKKYTNLVSPHKRSQSLHTAGALKSHKQRLQPQLNAPKRSYIRDPDMDVDVDYYPTSVNLRRTVKNDIAYGSASTMPPLPTFRYIETPRRLSPPKRNDSWESDPFDCYEVPVARPYDVSEPRHLNRSVRAAHMDVLPAKGILRTSSNSSSLHNYDRPLPMPSQYSSINSGNGSGNNDLLQRKRYTSLDENSHLSQEMRVRLQRTPDATQSMGIFSNPYAPNARDPRQLSNAGHRIVVSNLHNSVSQSDIKELFEDIGELIDARLVRSGVAEVIFEKQRDAEIAVETYHNRQLDGQPMKCLLVNQRASNKPTAPAIKPSRSNLTKSSKVEIDIDALHSVLFRRS